MVQGMKLDGRDVVHKGAIHRLRILHTLISAVWNVSARGQPFHGSTKEGHGYKLWIDSMRNCMERPSLKQCATRQSHPTALQVEQGKSANVSACTRPEFNAKG
jgi:hypothetical protein